MNRRNTAARLAAWVAAGALISQAPVWAKELDEGTVINKDNVESLLNDTFEGHPISELCPTACGFGCARRRSRCAWPMRSRRRCRPARRR